MTGPRERSPKERWPKVTAHAVFFAEGCAHDCEVRVQVGGYGRDHCTHGKPLRLAYIGTDEPSEEIFP